MKKIPNKKTNKQKQTKKNKKIKNTEGKHWSSHSMQEFRIMNFITAGN